MNRIAATVATGDAARISRSARGFVVLRGIVGTCLLIACATTAVRAQDCNNNGIPDEDEFYIGGAPPAGAIESPINSHVYWLTGNMSWDSAKALAESMGGHLATIRNEAENQWIVSTYAPVSPEIHLWIGLNDIGHTGTWVWVSGEPVTFTRWRSGQPDNIGGEHVGQIFVRSGFGWAPGEWNNHESYHEWPALIEFFPGNDCNSNGALDECDIADQTSDDCNMNGTPDECEFGGDGDCNTNGVIDLCDTGGIADCNLNGIPDFCDIANGAADCDSNGVPDACDTAATNIALRFDGLNDVVQLPNDLIHSRVILTLEARFRTTSNGVIFGYQNAQYPSGPSNWVPSLYVGSDGKLRGAFWSSAGANPITTTVSVNDGMWHHVALVGSVNIQSLYLDGLLVNPSPLSASISHVSMTGNQIGVGYNGSPWPSAPTFGWNPFNGDIDEVRIWNKALSGTEIAARMNVSLTMPFPDLVGSWSFRQAAGQFAGDDSGNNNGGTLGLNTNPGGDSSDPTWIVAQPILGSADCNTNGILDECDIADMTSGDCNSNGVPDECEFAGDVDCDSNGTTDLCEPGGGLDCDFNGIPDFCDIANGATDCNSNGLIDDCEFVSLTRALEFDGVDDWVRVPRSSSFEPTDDLTVEAWVRPDSAGSFHSRIVRTSGHFAPGYILAWQQQGDGRVQMRIDGAELGSAAAKDTVPTSAYFGQWHHIAGVYSLSEGYCRLYVDGVMKAEVPAVGHLQYAGSDLVIGNFYAQTNEDFDGAIDEVRIWNVARTEQELNDHMNFMLVGSEPGLVAYWRFDEGTGQIAHDLSGSGNHGTLGNNADPGGDALDPAWISPGAPINTADCNTNGILDECDIADGTSDDCNFNGMPDECEPNEDCNSNGMKDICDLGSGASLDCNSNGTPDECEEGGDQDCNTNGISDLCDLFTGASEDCDGNLVPDECDNDFDNDSVIDGCDNCPYNRNIKQTDSDEDGIGNICDNCTLTANTDQADEDNDGIGDVCDNCPSIANAANQTDSDSDGVGDVCDQCPGFNDLADQDGDCIADGCDLCPTRATGDVNGDGVVNAADIGPFTDVLLNGTISFLKICASDVNGDFKVTEADIGPFCDLIMNGGCQ